MYQETGIVSFRTLATQYEDVMVTEEYIAQSIFTSPVNDVVENLKPFHFQWSKHQQRFQREYLSQAVWSSTQNAALSADRWLNFCCATMGSTKISPKNDEILTEDSKILRRMSICL